MNDEVKKLLGSGLRRSFSVSIPDDKYNKEIHSILMHVDITDDKNGSLVDDSVIITEEDGLTPMIHSPFMSNDVAVPAEPVPRWVEKTSWGKIIWFYLPMSPHKVHEGYVYYHKTNDGKQEGGKG